MGCSKKAVRACIETYRLVRKYEQQAKIRELFYLYQVKAKLRSDMTSADARAITSTALKNIVILFNLY
jgi:hypothetical protein